MTTSIEIKISYTRAIRCWRSNNLRLCLQTCNQLTSKINSINSNALPRGEYAHLKQLIWSLKIKCLAEDCYVNESLLLNADDIESKDQVRTFTTASTNKRPNLSRQNASSSITITGRQQSRRSDTGAIVADQRKTAIVTGRMPSASSRQTSGGGNRASSSYRPLTTSLTASQTAFSRSTRPLLKYASKSLLSKTIYEYLYNVQRVTNKCPDYRQCLEYLNMVQQSLHKRMKEKSSSSTSSSSANNNGGQLIVLLDDEDENIKNLKLLDVFWLLAFGICYFNLRMNKLALDYFNRAKRLNPKHMDAYLWLIKIYLRQNEPIEVLRTCDDGLQNCKNAILFNWKARVQSLMNDSFAAHVSLKESLNFYPTNIEALANVGHFSFYGDKLDLALKCFERINQLTLNTSSGPLKNSTDLSNSELLNNLALCNFYCGNLRKVIPLFQQAFLCSPNKEVTSNIWYNLSFLPLNLGFQNLAIACLNLSLKNNSQNEEAINNLGVLKYGPIINDSLHYKNRQELWSLATDQRRGSGAKNSFEDMKNYDHIDFKRQQVLFDEAETYFSAPRITSTLLNERDDDGNEMLCNSDEMMMTFGQPEMLFNMAVLKHKRGQLLSSIKYCQHYLEFDPNNYMIWSLIREIRQLVSHDTT